MVSPEFHPYNSSTLSLLPTAEAARSKVESVTDRFVGSSPTSNLGWYGSNGSVGLAYHSVTIARTQVFTGFMTSAGMCRVS